ncbi:UdgX family uracil-DNA binding protein [Sandaracinobacteroides saxicola]|uniref:Type-4 uracil-DNA glycosylase n=1 Tax=Sandaracinobacteroides saxicola TaxID=2759707 RepID=A0A7G5IL08_9SPHN|nr:UdgX family uracil-DNA binding protein [Sandaracinobacteroides saxicola]QMW24050.1 UdgX family uracil-DNA binding protein [Sandaracinobacteroides saxicola]
MPTVLLNHPADFDGWRAAARRLTGESVPPGDVDWQVAGVTTPDLFGTEPERDAAPAAALRVPRGFIELAQRVVCHRDGERFRLLHQALVRLQAAPKLLQDRADPLVDRLEAMAKRVGRDVHKMRAFVRFREVADDAGGHFIAWFEPEHHILRFNAGFFVRRFANQRWTILTPDASAHWDGAGLSFLPGAARGDAPAEDPVEAIWQTYFSSIFNPARLKVKAMTSEMPKKYWKNMPEAALIPGMIAGAQARTVAMLERAMPEGDQEEGAAAALTGLRAEAARCKRCPLFGPATQTVFGEGPADARLMLVGEQPGDQEDVAGRVFVGPAGQLLDQALAAAGVDRARLYVTNAVKHFKFEQRGPRRIHDKADVSEIEACRWWLNAERKAVAPTLTVMLGAVAARSLTGRAVAIGKERGRVFALPDGTAGLITAHPSAVLRVPDAAARDAALAALVSDLRAAAAFVEGENGASDGT